jgi:hypothetical protein
MPGQPGLFFYRGSLNLPMLGQHFAQVVHRQSDFGDSTACTAVVIAVTASVRAVTTVGTTPLAAAIRASLRRMASIRQSAPSVSGSAVTSIRPFESRPLTPPVGLCTKPWRTPACWSKPRRAGAPSSTARGLVCRTPARDAACVSESRRSPSGRCRRSKSRRGTGDCCRTNLSKNGFHAGSTPTPRWSAGDMVRGRGCTRGHPHRAPRRPRKKFFQGRRCQ